MGFRKLRADSACTLPDNAIVVTTPKEENAPEIRVLGGQPNSGLTYANVEAASPFSCCLISLRSTLSNHLEVPQRWALQILLDSTDLTIEPEVLLILLGLKDFG